MSDVSLRSIYKAYNDIAAVLDFNLEIGGGEFVALCGPPGAGKSTVLKMIAGLEAPTSGEIRFDGAAAPEKVKDRNVAMMFQNYGLSFRKAVYDNVAYPLKIRKTPPAEIRARVLEAAELLEITPLLGKKPKKLSAEQNIRVQLARAAVRKPKLFLLDEPLTGLDFTAQERLGKKILELHSALNIPFIFASIDSAVCLRFNKRTVLMHNGVIRQIGTPENLRRSDDPFIKLFLYPEKIVDFNLQISMSRKAEPSGEGTDKIDLLQNPPE